MNRERRFPLRSKLFLFLLSFLLTLGVLEVAVRAFHLAPGLMTKERVGPFRFVDNPRLVYELVPRALDKDGVIINKQGFKDDDFVINKPSGVVRIVMLGDSITEGAGVPSGKTFSDCLESMLNERSSAAGLLLRYEVMNFGVGGYNLTAEVETLKLKALAYSPDIVVLNMFFQDDEPIPGVDLCFFVASDINDRDRLDIVRKYIDNRDSLVRKVLYKSKLFLFIVVRLDDLLRRDGLLFYRHGSFADKAAANRRIDEGLSEIKRLQQLNSFNFLICLHPRLGFSEDPRDDYYEEKAHQFGFPSFRMYDYYKCSGVAPCNLVLKQFPEDRTHPNELGHEIIANAMFLELKKNGFINGGLSCSGK